MKLSYDLYAANAPKIETGGAFRASPPLPAPGVPSGTLDMRMAGNKSGQFAGGFRLGVQPNALPGLALGLHGLRGSVEDDIGPPVNRTRLAMLGGYAGYFENEWELLGEYYRFRNDDLSGGTGQRSSSAWYAQAARSFGRYTPFGRYERSRLDQADNYFLIQEYGRSYTRSALGLRYDLDPKAALKLEWLRTDVTDLVPGIDDRYNEWRLQYAIRF